MLKVSTPYTLKARSKIQTWGKRGPNPKERNYLEELDVDGMTIYKWVFKKQDEDLNDTEIPEDMDKWRSSANRVMKLCGLHKMHRITWLDEDTFVSE